MKYYISILLFILVLLASLILPGNTLAIYDPLSVPNNKIGIHILFPSEITAAAQLVNSSGGNWGYVTIPIQEDDLSLIEWQAFMDQAKALHLIPIVRLATSDDFFNQSSWNVPTKYDVVEFANFLNSLSWPTKNRYIVVFNEPNDAKEWGGTPDPASYASILSFAVSAFKQRSKDFFIISAGLDNAAANVSGESVNEYDFMKQMNTAVSGIFGKIDAIASHSYPNPAFAQPPSYYEEGINSFYYERLLADYLGGKSLPVFITETGWDNSAVSENLSSLYYNQALKNQWSDSSIVAITPFLLSGSGPFSGFSLIDQSGSRTKDYNAIENFPKIKGQPETAASESPFVLPELEPGNLPVYTFSQTKSHKNFTVIAPKSTVLFLKWFLGYK